MRMGVLKEQIKRARNEQIMFNTLCNYTCYCSSELVLQYSVTGVK